MVKYDLKTIASPRSLQKLVKVQHWRPNHLTPLGKDSLLEFCDFPTILAKYNRQLLIQRHVSPTEVTRNRFYEAWARTLWHVQVPL